MSMSPRRAATVAALLGVTVMCQGCLVGAAVGTAGAVVGGTVHVAGAVGSAIIPGESKKQRAKRLEREERARERAARDARRG